MTRVIAVAMVVTLIANPVLADIVVLRAGVELRGTIANREEVNSRQSYISILLDGDLRRISTADIKYIVLEDGTTNRVIEFVSVPPSLPTTQSPLGEAEQNEAGSGNLEGAIALTVFGLAAGVVGGVVKFGDEKIEITSGSVQYDEKSYNYFNYVLIGVGVVSFIYGLSLISTYATPTGNGLAMRITW